MSRLFKDCQRSLSLLLDDRNLCQGSTIILAMCAICGVVIMAVSIFLHLAENI